MNNNIDILINEALEIPVVYDEQNGYTFGIINVLNNYIEALRINSISSQIISKVTNFKNTCEKMYDDYFLGHHNESYENFKKAIEDLINNELLITDLTETNFYRARYNTGNHDFKENEMYHIPFDMRGKVKTQRYSFPGLPCLYLGASTYACWLELNRPTIDAFQVALINMENSGSSLKVIDLSLFPTALYYSLQNGQPTLSLDDYLLLWPIIALCSVTVIHEDDDFKPEYIFPQFMLEYVLTMNNTKDYELIGIKYSSIKAAQISSKQYSEDWRTYTNYVFPVRSFIVNSSSECPYLHKYFKITNNYSGKELQILTDIVRKSNIVWESFDNNKSLSNNPLDDAQIYTTDSKTFKYSKSIFRRIEQVLELKDLSDDDNEVTVSPISNEEIAKLFDEVQLSELALQLLTEAAQDISGQLIKTYTLEGLSISTNNCDFARNKTAREIASLESSFNELIENGYIICLSSKGEIFKVTEKGYKFLEAK